MRYKSTCGSVVDVSFETALLSGGYTTLGGVYIPHSIPKRSFNYDNLSHLQDASFVTIAKYIAGLYISRDEIPKSDLDTLVEEALSPDKFHPEYIPIIDMGVDSDVTDDQGRICHLLRAEAYHSPSLVFKDYSMQVVGQYINYFTKKKQESEGCNGDAVTNARGSKGVRKSNVLICTTGDTGSSAIQALRGLDCVNVFVGFPGGSQITEFQRLQMTTVPDENVHCFQVEGTCDDIDLVYVDLFSRPELTAKYQLTSANSTNWARIMGQIAIFTYIYLQTIKLISNSQSNAKLGDSIKIVIPSGACGNVCSALFARGMGLPIDIIVANNSNAFFHRIYHEGDILVSSHNQKQTVSNAMDSQWSPALTRILWTLSPDDSTGLYDEEALRKLKQGQPIVISDQVKERLQNAILDCQLASDQETIDMMRCLSGEIGERGTADGCDGSTIPIRHIVCPHTAVGFVAARKHYQDLSGTAKAGDRNLKFNLQREPQVNDTSLPISKDEDVMVVFATAHPDKFSNVITEKAAIPYTRTYHFPYTDERYEQFARKDNWRELILTMLDKAN